MRGGRAVNWIPSASVRRGLCRGAHTVQHHLPDAYVDRQCREVVTQRREILAQVQRL
jgi:hypothetical protein|eukprot:COSAG01_NODE_191_length_22545_cov_259.478838_19_plen_57_part_00